MKVFIWILGGVVFGLFALFLFTKLGFLKRSRAQYSCPVSQRSCRSAEVVMLGDDYYGLAFRVPEGEEYLSVVDSEGMGRGVLMLANNNGSLEKYRYTRLEGPDYSVVYLVNGEPLNIKQNKMFGEVLGIVPVDNLGVFGEYNLVIFWEEKSGKKIEVLPKDF